MIKLSNNNEFLAFFIAPTHTLRQERKISNRKQFVCVDWSFAYLFSYFIVSLFYSRLRCIQFSIFAIVFVVVVVVVMLLTFMFLVRQHLHQHQIYLISSNFTSSNFKSIIFDTRFGVNLYRNQSRFHCNSFGFYCENKT